MNLWFRLIWLALSLAMRGRSLTLPQQRSRLRFHVWPLDLDASLHMNNGRYLTIMDLGRLDVMGRSGLLSAVLHNRWTPIASTITIRYRRELRPFQCFELETGLLAWDETHVVMEQIFRIAGGGRDGEIAARALFKGGLYDRRARKFVPISRLMSEIGVNEGSPAPSPEVEAFLKADEELKRAGVESKSSTAWPIED